MTLRTSIVIPCYNEAGNLPAIVERVSALCAQNPQMEFVLVNNGSKDDSAAVFQRELAKQTSANIRLVTVEVNQGYGYGILAGLREASGDLLGWTHADMQTDPADALRAIQCFEEADAPCLVKGRRINRGFVDAGFTFGMSIVSWFALRMWLSDINAQPKLFSRAFYETLTDAPHDFSLDLYVLFRAKQTGLPIRTIPVVFAKRLHGEAKGGGSLRTKIPLVKRTFAYIRALRRNLCA